MVERLTHAGAVAFRKRDNETLYLLVSSSDGANWVLPKGHIDQGETPEVTALRELAEEAGVSGEIVNRLSIHRFQKAGKEVGLEYFLIRETGFTNAKEKRILRWENEDTAHQVLTFDEAKTALLEGAAMLRRLEQDLEGCRD